MSAQELFEITDYCRRTGLAETKKASPMPEKLAIQPAVVCAPEGDGQRSFRFFDNRQKYLLFVNTCSEKQVVADRVSQELTNIHPRPPALRLFDAGAGDGSVLTRVMRAMHDR